LVKFKTIATLLLIICFARVIQAQVTEVPIILQNSFFYDGNNTVSININDIAVSNSNQDLSFISILSAPNNILTAISEDGNNLYLHPTSNLLEYEILVNVCDDGNGDISEVHCTEPVVKILNQSLLNTQNLLSNDDFGVFSLNSNTYEINIAENDLIKGYNQDSLDFIILDQPASLIITSNTNGLLQLVQNGPMINDVEFIRYYIIDSTSQQVSDTSKIYFTFASNLQAPLILNDDFITCNTNFDTAIDFLQNDIFNGPITIEILSNSPGAIDSLSLNNSYLYPSQNSLLASDSFRYVVSSNFYEFQSDTAWGFITKDNAFNCTDCVYPGDCNNSGRVNNKDILDIGLNFGGIGPSRDFADLNFNYQYGSSWLTNAIQINPKFADANGDGLINTSDVAALELNYNKNWSNNEQEVPINLNGPVLTFEELDDTLVSNQHLTIPLKIGNPNLNIQNLYGISFTISFDESIINADSINFITNNSWLINGDSIIEIQRTDTNKLEIGLSRINQQGVSGNGNLGELSIIIEDNIIGEIDNIGSTNLSISKVKAINANGQTIELNPLETALTYFDGLTNNSTFLNGKHLPSIQIYPNPAQNFIQLKNNTTKTSLIQILDATGKLMQEVHLETAQNSIIDISKYNSGIYFISSDKGEIFKVLKLNNY